MKSEKDKKKTINKVASYRENIAESPDSKMSRRALVDRVPGKPRIVAQQEWLQQKRVEKGVFFGKIESADEYSFKIIGKKKLKSYELKESIVGGSETKLITLDSILDSEELNLMENLKTKLQELKAENLTFYLDSFGANFSFKFPKESDYNCFLGVIVHLVGGDILKFDGIFTKRQAYSLILEKKDMEKDYSFTSNTPVDWNYFMKVLHLKEIYPEVLKTL